MLAYPGLALRVCGSQATLSMPTTPRDAAAALLCMSTRMAQCVGFKAAKGVPATMTSSCRWPDWCGRDLGWSSLVWLSCSSQPPLPPQCITNTSRVSPAEYSQQ